MSRRRRRDPETTWPPHRVTFVCSGCGSHPARMLARLGVTRDDDGTVGVLHREGTDITRPLPEPWTFTYAPGPAELVLHCQTCHAHATYPGERLLAVIGDALGDGSALTADVDICYLR